MEVTIIAAMSLNRVIGRGASIPWHIPEEQLQFKKITMGNTLLMGRKTFESIGKVLPGRRSIVISRNELYRADGCEVANGLQDSFSLCESRKNIFVIGGEQIFKQVLPDAYKIILTTILRVVSGDVFFPEFEGFTKVSVQKHEGPDPYITEIFRRK